MGDMLKIPESVLDRMRAAIAEKQRNPPLRVRGHLAAASRRTEAKITAEEARATFGYDPDTGEVHWKTGLLAGRRAGSAGTRYRQVRWKRSQVSEHRLIWLLVNGFWPVAEIDHRDGNTRNNALSNLREASTVENNHHTVRPVNSSTGFRCVQRSESGKRFKARITIAKRHFILGTFGSADEAASAIEHVRSLVGLPTREAA